MLWLRMREREQMHLQIQMSLGGTSQGELCTCQCIRAHVYAFAHAVDLYSHMHLSKFANALPRSRICGECVGSAFANALAYALAAHLHSQIVNCENLKFKLHSHI